MGLFSFAFPQNILILAVVPIPVAVTKARGIVSPGAGVRTEREEGVDKF